MVLKLVYIIAVIASTVAIHNGFYLDQLNIK